MSDLKSILDATKKLESLLESKCGSSGRGLHEKLSNSRVPIPENLAKRIRYIATMRNKAVHEDGFDIPNPDGFFQMCKDSLAELQALPAAGALPPILGSSPAGTASLKKVALLGLVLGGLVWGWSMLNHKQAPVTKDAPLHSVSPAQEQIQTVKADSVLDFSVGNIDYRLDDFFKTYNVKIDVKVTNQSQVTLKTAKFAAKLYLNDDQAPVFTTSGESFSREPRHLLAFFGDKGLPAGETRQVTIDVDTHFNSQWTMPDVLNAKQRRVSLALLDAQDGREKTIQIASTVQSAEWR